MPFVVANRRHARERLIMKYGDVPLLDLTSKGPLPWRRFSPFYPHGGIPIPFSPGHTAMSVEGIWQGLKVFEKAPAIDPTKFSIRTMEGLKRSTRTFGPMLGHQAGVNDTRLLRYIQARYRIYLPAYRWALEHCLQREVAELAKMGQDQMVVLLDYATNGDVEDESTPLSHAALVKRYLEHDWPTPRRASSSGGQG
jgi:hypothetical protein